MAALNDVWRVRIVSLFGQQVAINVTHWKVTAHAGTGATDAQVATAFDTAFAANMKGSMSVAASYRGVDVARIFPLPPGNATVGNAGAGGGTTAGDPLPKQVSGLISKRTAFGGRKFRGRFYVPFPSETDNLADNSQSANYKGGLDALGVILRTAVVAGAGGNTDTFTPVIWHRATTTSDTVIGTISRYNWATQRRRGDLSRTNVVPF